MELVKLTHENIDKEHICCAISNNKDIQVISKKNWLKERLEEGLVFLKGKLWVREESHFLFGGQDHKPLFPLRFTVADT